MSANKRKRSLKSSVGTNDVKDMEIGRRGILPGTSNDMTFHGKIGDQSYEEIGLSNFLVLKEIFSNLSYGDLKSCCEVSPLWMSVADPIMCQYRISVIGKRRNRNVASLCQVSMSKTRGYAGYTERCDLEKPDINSVVKELRSVKKNQHSISIKLEIISRFNNIYPEESEYLSFLSEFGDKVHVLEATSEGCELMFKEFLTHLSYFNNLETLKCKLHFSTREWQCEGEVNNVEKPKILPCVKKFSLGAAKYFLRWKQLLGMMPNVRELLDVPVDFAAVFAQFGNSGIIKSLAYPDVEGHDVLRIREDQLHRLSACLQHIGDLRVQLKYCAVPNMYEIPKRQGISLKRQFQRILESSKDSAKLIKIPAAKNFEFFFPLDFQMNSVKILQFVDDSPGLEYKDVRWSEKESARRVAPQEEHHYFPAETDLRSMFPNLEGLEIAFDIQKRHLLKFFPVDTFGPEMLGTTVKKLKIHGASPDCFDHLLTLFPHVTHLEMDSTVPHFHQVFPKISAGWRALEHLVVFIDSFKGLHVPSQGRLTNCSLDSVLTGIPDNVCQDLIRGSKCRKKIPEDEIRKLQKANTSLLDMKDLKKLEFIFDGSEFLCNICWVTHSPVILAEMTATYALKQRPDLEVYVRMCEDQYNYATEFDYLRKQLAPVAEHVKFDNNYSIPEYPFI